jgi:hypothetical protein
VADRASQLLEQRLARAKVVGDRDDGLRLTHGCRV